MTEAEWLTATDLEAMLAFLRVRFTQRKWALYLSAGLRQIWDRWLYSDLSWKAVEVAERMAEGAATDDEVRVTAYYAETPTFGYDFAPWFIRRYHPNAEFSAGIRRLIAMGVLRESEITFPTPPSLPNDVDGDNVADIEEMFSGEQLGDPEVVDQLLNAANIAEGCLSVLGDWVVNRIPRQRDWPGGWLLRDLFGNPFRPVAVDPAWLTETAVGIARGIYDDRAFERLPILADALQDAGCEDEQVLSHCREPGTHVRGCWVVDLVLGKS